jgi:hypothetical protein
LRAAFSRFEGWIFFNVINLKQGWCKKTKIIAITNNEGRVSASATRRKKRRVKDERNERKENN